MHAGFRAEKSGRRAEAEELYRRAIADGDGYGFNNLAQLLVEDGRTSEAEALYREGIRAGDSLAAKNYALLLVEEGRDEDATAAIAVARRMGTPPSEEDLRYCREWREQAVSHSALGCRSVTQ